MSTTLARFLGRVFRHTPHTKKPGRTRLGCEGLEDRTVPTPVLTIAALANVAEPSGSATFRISMSGYTAMPFSVNYSLGGTATSGTDYTTAGSASFSPSQSFTDITVNVVDDSTSEPTETIVFTLNTSSSYTVGSPGSATMNLVDDDPDVVTVTKVNDTAEGGTAGTFRFTRTGSLTSGLTVGYTVGGTATSGTDFSVPPGAVVFAAGSATADVTVTPLVDNVVESGGESVSMTASTGTGYSVGSPSSASLTIADDPPVVSLTVIEDTAEWGRDGLVRFTRTGGDLTHSLVVAYTAGGTAVGGTDFSTLSGTVTFAANAATADVTVIATADATDDPGETRSS